MRNGDASFDSEGKVAAAKSNILGMNMIPNGVPLLTSRGDIALIFAGAPGMISQDKSSVIQAKRLYMVR